MNLRLVTAITAMLILLACQPTARPPVPAAPPSLQVPSPTSIPTEVQPPMNENTLDLDEANVTFVKATQTSDGTWRFDVTVRHHDEGWDHYADGWDVVTPDGTVLKTNAGDAFTRVLLHPHETEQPFTRSQSGLTIPAGVSEVTVRAHCNVHGFGGQDVSVDLTVAEGPNFQVQRP